MTSTTKIIQLTDLHLRERGGDVLGIDPAERLATVIGAINTNHGDAACCVVTGDIADAAEAGAYGLARELLSGLKIPYAVTLGNHDARAPFRHAFPDAPLSGGGFVQSVIDLGAVAAVLVDTLDEDHAGQGYVCGRRLAWIDTQLRRLAGKPVIVFMHHPPFSIGLAWFESMLIANGDDVMALIRRHANVLHLAFGHVHVNTHGVRNGLSFSGSRGTCHKILAHPSRLEADYVDQGAAYDVLLHADGMVCVHTIEPAGRNRLIARELPTEDGKGIFENLRQQAFEQWI